MRKIGGWGRVLGLTAWLIGAFAAATRPARAQQPAFNGDPDASRPTLHVQPPALGAPNALHLAATSSSTVNGIFINDVLLSAGLDIGFADLGNEPSITYNPLDQSRIVLTSFSGSNWGGGGNSTLFYSSDAGNTWTYTASVPLPPGAFTNINCPCDQTLDWGRDGILSATFLHYGVNGSPQTVYSGQATDPVNPASWSYNVDGFGSAQPTSQPGLAFVDQPWIAGGPLISDPTKTSVSVAYDNFDGSFSFEEMRSASSHASSPLDFDTDAAVNADGQAAGDGMNPGHRIAVGPNGIVFDLFQRWGFNQTATVRSITYLLSVSTDGGATWHVGNSNHLSGAKIVASGLSFQGNGSKVGGVNALLGGITAITVDPATGVAWLVYGTRATATTADRLFLVSATYSSGNLTIGTPHQISPATSSYLPGVAVLSNGEIGVLFLSYDGTNFTYRFIQTNDGGVTIAKTTTLTTFTSPFTNNGASNQRIFGDYLQVRAAGCTFYGAYAARGTGPNSVNSIDPWFMRAPAFAACADPTLTALSTHAACAGGPGFNVTITGTGFLPSGNGRFGGAQRPTTFLSPTQVQMAVPASDIASPGIALIDYLGAPPGGVLTSAQPLGIEPPAESTGDSLRITKSGANAALAWNQAQGASSYNVRRCTATSSCTPQTIATPFAHTYLDPVLGNGSSYWYSIDAVNSCGAVP
jgi:hypothetical protein